MAGIFVYHPRTPSPLPEYHGANFSSHHHHTSHPHTVSSRAMDEFRANEFWPHPRAVVEAMSHMRHGSHTNHNTTAPNVVPASGPTKKPKGWDEWEKNKNWPYPACLPAHEVARLRKQAEADLKANAAAAAGKTDSSNSSASKPHSTPTHANSNWPYPANGPETLTQKHAPAPPLVQPAPRTAAQRSQWPPPDFQWSQQPHQQPSYDPYNGASSGYSTDPEGRPRGYNHPRRTQRHEPSTSQTTTSNMMNRLKSAFSSKRKSEQISPIEKPPNHQEPPSRRASKKQNILQAGQGRQDYTRTSVRINPYLIKGSSALVLYDLRFSDRYVKKTVVGGRTHLNQDDLDMPACEPRLPHVRIYMPELVTWTIDVRPQPEARAQFVTVGDVLYAIYKTMKQRVDAEIWNRDKMHLDFQERVNRAFSWRCKAIAKKKNLSINLVAQDGLWKVDYLGTRYQFAGLTHAYGTEGGEWFMMESVAPEN